MNAPAPPPDTPDVAALLAENERLRRTVRNMEAADALRRESYARLAAECDAFRAAFDDNPVMQLWCDSQGRVLRANKSLQSAMGMEAPPQGYTVFTDPQLIMLGVPRYFKQALQGSVTRIPRYTFNPSKAHGTGLDADFTMETVIHPVFGPDGRVESVVVQHFVLDGPTSG